MLCYSLSTSSSMPHSSSMVTHASIGNAISLLLMARCSSRAFPYDGFSIQASETHHDGHYKDITMQSPKCNRKKFTDRPPPPHHTLESHHLTKLVRLDIKVEVESLTLVSFDLWQHTLQNLQRLPVILRLNLYELQQDQ